MGLLRYICAICVWSVVPFDARGGVRDLEAEAAARIAERFVVLAGSKENAVALALSLRTGGLVMLVTGKDPITTYEAIWKGTGLQWLFPWTTGAELVIDGGLLLRS